MAPLRILAHWRAFSPLAVTYHSTCRQDRYVFSTKSTPWRRGSKNRKSLLPESTQSLKNVIKSSKSCHTKFFSSHKKRVSCGSWLSGSSAERLRCPWEPRHNCGCQKRHWAQKNTFKSVLFSRQLWYKHQLLINLYSNFDKYPKKFAYWTNKWVRILFTFFRNILEIFKSTNIHSPLNAHLSIFAFLLKHP